MISPHSNYYEHSMSSMVKPKNKQNRKIDSKIINNILLENNSANEVTENTEHKPPSYYNVNEQSNTYTNVSSLVASYILDPLSVIIKLAILSKKAVGCKLCILNHVLHIQEPGVFQPLVRFIYKNSKEDLSYLYNPIEIACNYFIRENPPSNIKSMIILFEMAQNGLLQLIEQYREHNTIIHNLYMYRNIIMNYIGEHYNPTLFIVDGITESYKKEYVDKLNSKWTEVKIKMVMDMLFFIDQDENMKKNIKCLEEFMINIDKDTVDYFNEVAAAVAAVKEETSNVSKIAN
jgi:hypothetical protein